MFINFSNHPSDKWETAQIDAARKYGEIVDIPFPDVPADADEEKIEQIACECLQTILSSADDIKAVMAQGEFTLTYKIVVGLKEKKIKVMSACAQREVSEYIDEKGNNVKKSVFRFVRFREY